MSFPPIACPVTLQPWQGYFQGVTFGASTPYQLLTIPQGFDMVAINSQDVQYPRAEGEIIGLDVAKGRDISLDFWVAPAQGLTIQQLVLNLASAFQVQGNLEVPLWINLPGWGTLGFMVRTRKRHMPIDLNYSAASLAKPKVVVHATDPLAYGPTQTATITPASGSGGAGVTFPITFPVSFAQVTAGVTVTNSGNFPVDPVVTFIGPIATPTISCNGQNFTLYNPNQGSGNTLESGETVEVDFRTHSVVYNVTGTPQLTAVNSWVVYGSSYFDLPPGNSTIVLSTGSASSGSVQVQYASGWFL